jgi:hypothetical protein
LNQAASGNILQAEHVESDRGTKTEDYKDGMEMEI